VKELADYEWHDLKIFIDRAMVKRGAGTTNRRPSPASISIKSIFG